MRRIQILKPLLQMVGAATATTGGMKLVEKITGQTINVPNPLVLTGAWIIGWGWTRLFAWLDDAEQNNHGEHAHGHNDGHEHHPHGYQSEH